MIVEELGLRLHVFGGKPLLLVLCPATAKLREQKKEMFNGIWVQAAGKLHSADEY